MVSVLVGLALPAVAQENIGSSTVQSVSPTSVTAGSTFDLCVTANIISPDIEYLDRLEVNLPDGWTVNSVATNSVPVAQGCGSALPPVVGTDAGNVVYWQSTGYPPATGCGAWNGGSGGTNFDFCANVTVPNCTGAPWDLPWNIIGDGWGGEPHSATGTWASITCEGGGGAAIVLTKTVGTVPAVCAVTDEITVATGTEVYYCFVAENTGDVTFNFHDLVDDHLGTILDAYPYTLAPGALSPEVIIPETVTGPTVNTATWTAVDVIGGYAVDDTIAYNFEDIPGTGTVIPLSDDEVSGAIPLGFTFDYFGTGYSDIYVSSNGFLTVLPGQSNGCCSGQPIPTAGSPDGVISGWWDDFYPPGGGPVTYQTLGSAPNRYAIVQFTNVPHCCSPGNLPVTMQFKLFESSNIIEVHYQAALATGDGSSHSAGVENQDGTVGVQYYYGTEDLPTPLAVRYTPQLVTEASATDTATVNISDPDINVTPASMVSSLLIGTTETQVLTIGNTGTGVLDWTIDEAGAPTAVVGPFPQILEVAGPGDASVAAERVGDVPAGKVPTWYPERGPWGPPEAVIYDNGPIVTHPGGGAGGADASALQTALGMDTYGFGAQLIAGNRVADDFTVTYAGGWQIDTITFFAYQTGSGTTSSIYSLNLQIWDGPPDGGGSVIWGDTTTNIMTSTTWSNIYRVLDTALTNTDRPVMAVVGTVGTVLPPGTYWLDWQFDGSPAFSGPWQPPITILGQTTTGNAKQFTSSGWADLVDGVTLTPQGLPFIMDGAASQCMMPEDVPWLSVSPNAGTTPGGGSTPVDVTFDATAVGVGTYNALLCVLSNDPDEPLVEVPVEMNVVIPVELIGISIE
jgi:hypothetical protein